MGTITNLREGEPMPEVRMDIQSIVVGGGPMASLVVLKPRHEGSAPTSKLPIRIGRIEAAAISMGVDSSLAKRPTTHDLLSTAVERLGARITSVCVVDVRDTTFYAEVRLSCASGESLTLDARPSDALALAVRAHAPIFASLDVLNRAALPDFGGVEQAEREREEAAFHEFVEGLSPEDFA